MSDEVSSVASSLGAGVKEVYDTLIEGNSSVSDGSTIIEMDVRGGSAPKGGGGSTNKLLLGLAGALGLGVALILPATPTGGVIIIPLFIA